jgi:hypothetical protein
LYIILRTFFPIFCLLSFASYKKGYENENAQYDKYLIEMNSGYRLSKVTHVVGENTVEYEKSYEYFDKHIKVQIKGGLWSTYFLNQDGLADSCIEGTNKFKY